MPNTPTLLSVVDTSPSLGSGATYNGPARNMHAGFENAPGVPPGRRATSVVVTANPASPATIKIQVSADWSAAVPTWTTIDQLAAPGGSQVSKEIPIGYRWVRVQVLNGAVTQVVATTTAFVE